MLLNDMPPWSTVYSHYRKWNLAGVWEKVLEYLNRKARKRKGKLYSLLNDFSYCVDTCTCFMNEAETPVLVFEQSGNYLYVIHNDYYQLLIEEANI